jgi:hypothetical protein
MINEQTKGRVILAATIVPRLLGARGIELLSGGVTRFGSATLKTIFIWLKIDRPGFYY